MRVIAKPRLREFWQRHPAAKEPLLAWWKTALKADWSSIQDVRRTYTHADAIMLDCGLLVTAFNIGGNKFRLVTTIIYEYRRIYIKRVLTHAEYTAGRWKEQLCRE